MELFALNPFAFMKNLSFEGTYLVQGWTFTRISDGLVISRRRSRFPKRGAETFLYDTTNKTHISTLFTDRNPYEFEFNGNRYKLEFVADSVVITLKAILSPSKQRKGNGGAI